MPTTSEIKAFYDNYIDNLDKFTTRHEAVLHTFDIMVSKEFNVLDIGCGTGITTKHLAGLAKSVIGVDLSPVLIEHAIKNNSKPNSQYFAADIVEWDWPSKFDFISMVDVFEHIPLERIPTFMNTLKKFSYDNTQIYLNIPTGDVIRYLKKNYPESLQIVDVPHDDVLDCFKTIDFYPTYFKVYWVQYVEYIFETEVSINKRFDEIFQPLKRSNYNG